MITIYTPNSHIITVWGLSNDLIKEGYEATSSLEGSGMVITNAPRKVVVKILRKRLKYLPDDELFALYRIEES